MDHLHDIHDLFAVFRVGGRGCSLCTTFCLVRDFCNKVLICMCINHPFLLTLSAPHGMLAGFLYNFFHIEKPFIWGHLTSSSSCFLNPLKPQATYCVTRASYHVPRTAHTAKIVVFISRWDTCNTCTTFLGVRVSYYVLHKYRIGGPFV